MQSFRSTNFQNAASTNSGFRFNQAVRLAWSAALHRLSADFPDGLNWGGGLYAWPIGHVVGVPVGGAVDVILSTLWEILLPCWTTSVEPFLPLHRFKSLRYMSCALLTAIGAGVYYGFSLTWPQCVAFIYKNIKNEANKNTLSELALMCFVIG